MSVLKKIAFRILPDGVQRSLRSSHYKRKFKALKGTEEPEMDVIRGLVSSGDLVLDIGANFGTYSKFLSNLVGDNGKVVSFEPIPEVFTYLNQNLNSLHIKNVQPINAALSNKPGTASFKIPEFDHSGKNFYEGHLTDGEGDIKVEVKTLDTMKFDKRVKFIKCDVEGFEFEVLNGAAQLIKKDKPIWMLEINAELSSAFSQKILNFMAAKEYEIWYLGDGKLSKENNAFQGVNYFFLPK